jgi:hypothetical protein
MSKVIRLITVYPNDAPNPTIRNAIPIFEAEPMIPLSSAEKDRHDADEEEEQRNILPNGCAVKETHH